jgi:hypothetical protein
MPNNDKQNGRQKRKVRSGGEEESKDTIEVEPICLKATLNFSKVATSRGWLVKFLVKLSMAAHQPLK